MTEKTKGIKKRLEIVENQLRRERVRTNRIVTVLLRNLSDKQLKTRITFHGESCEGRRYDWWESDGFTLEDFLRIIVDP